jgi:hypothetical protein
LENRQHDLSAARAYDQRRYANGPSGWTHQTPQLYTATGRWEQEKEDDDSDDNDIFDLVDGMHDEMISDMRRFGMW